MMTRLDTAVVELLSNKGYTEYAEGWLDSEGLQRWEEDYPVEHLPSSADYQH